jgi:hypothetical protein
VRGAKGDRAALEGELPGSKSETAVIRRGRKPRRGSGDEARPGSRDSNQGNGQAVLRSPVPGQTGASEEPRAERT